MIRMAATINCVPIAVPGHVHMLAHLIFTTTLIGKHMMNIPVWDMRNLRNGEPKEFLMAHRHSVAGLNPDLSLLLSSH